LRNVRDRRADDGDSMERNGAVRSEVIFAVLSSL
jgi:hypothetical protein